MIGYTTGHTRLFFFHLHRPIPIAGSFYRLGGRVGGVAGSENHSKDSMWEDVGGFVGCLRQIYVDKLPATVKRLSGFTLNSVRLQYMYIDSYT